MSQRDIEMLREAYDAYNKAFDNPNPMPRLRAALERYLDPEIEWINASESPDEATAVGIDAVERWFESGLEVWETMRQVPEEFRDAGDRVVVFVRVEAKERESGIELSEHWAHVCTVRQARIVRLEQFREREMALEAAELSGYRAPARSDPPP